MKKINTLAQTEVIGLVIIVIIVAMGMLFYVSYKTTDKREDTLYSQYTDNELATSFVNALLKTSVCGEDVDALIKL